MADAIKPPTGAWRIPKACQECRKRKIRCNGLNPCKTCQQRETPCIYREVTRQRKRRIDTDHPLSESDSRHAPRVSPSFAPNSKTDGPSMMVQYPSSVSATHMASPSCKLELYYGPTSHFSLIQHVYHELVPNASSEAASSGQVEEAGAGLDLFSFRRIFFGTPDSQEAGKSFSSADMGMMFLPYNLAKIFLDRYLAHLYHVMPHQPKAYFKQCLEKLYDPSPSEHPDTLTRAMLLLSMAIGSLGTEQYAWGDVLFERVKESLIPSYGNYQNEQGRPNSAFLHLGTATRKAISAGLHKDVPPGDIQRQKTIEERRVTFWSLYNFETWFCFHVGRPSSLYLKDVAIEYAQDPFVRLLTELCKTISRSGNEIYSQRHESLLHMWRVARSIIHDLRNHEVYMKQALGFDLDASIEIGSLGVRQTIFITLYYHTLLLTFRPFLIFRGHWKRSLKASTQPPDTNAPPRSFKVPTWLNEACNHAITAASKTIHHLSEASRRNDLVKQLRYHGHFLSSSAFTLIYDLLHDPSTATSHLPWIYTTLQTLGSMRPGDPIDSTISAIQTVLRKINPSYEFLPYSDQYTSLKTKASVPMSSPAGNTASQPYGWIPSATTFTPRPGFTQNFDLSAPQWNLQHLEGPETGASSGSTDDLLDFTQSDMGWNFDFSTMDLEAFCSTYDQLSG
ncbi:Fungal Zn(2)-Cys(6) binuclear cluster domain-containing protein [Penicillium ucsense]|uniref:Fungal Zn(2)-Cys(6) binuclear cluster domain-containing protein n=1 Tax=Penicillium ucsense TaxID=2839758 RepID=A0A8J8WJJ8_9EURO|nr:Fungal Zn(2)-Cys(6) binuclear cluster domain-containing protein [Penicillium ucsense]KAF7735090.1 Fungal Zn(2)-Cys(6) binuclear cluster domain-containing protein [Penicillium ucsense]